MPGFDGTGPNGAGPMTGGARGYCVAGAGVGGAPRGFARGGGFGRGGGRGWRNRFYATGVPGWAVANAAATANDTLDSQQELAMLQQQCAAMETRLSQLQSRIDAIKAESQK